MISDLGLPPCPDTEQSPDIIIGAAKCPNCHDDKTTMHDVLQSASEKDYPHGLHETFVSTSKAKPGDSLKYVEWGINWYQEPAAMAAYAIIALILAIGHHIYYASLNGKVAVTERRQQYAKAFGNAFAIAIVALLGAANRESYQQLVWMLVRRKSFRLATLDGLFALTSDPTKFLNLEAWRHAFMGTLLGLLCWGVTLASILPPGSLSVISGPVTRTSLTYLPAFNWNPDLWTELGSSNPLALVVDIGTVTAAAEILSYDPPAPKNFNSSFTREIRGPFLQCNYANETQAPIFDYYQQSLLGSEKNRYTAQTWPPHWPFNQTGGLLDTIAAIEAGDGSTSEATVNIWTAFDVPRYNTSDYLNYWPALLPPTFWNTSGYLTADDPETLVPENWTVNSLCRMFPLQLWILTSNDTFVCTYGTGTRRVQFSFISGSQTVSYGELYDFEPHYLPILENKLIHDVNSFGFETAYEVLSSYIRGNLSLKIDWSVKTPTNLDMQHPIINAVKASAQSNVYMTALDACDEIRDSFWSEKVYMYDFSKSLNHCRNSSVLRAIEDFSTNFTINLLSSDLLTTPNTTATNITVTELLSVYKYDPLTLVLPYTIAITLTCISVCIGLYSFSMNGVSHSSVFSAFMCTTRNPALDNLTEGQSLGTSPLDGKLSSARLRFGVLHRGNKKRVGFGLEDDVECLEKGKEYIRRR